MLHWGDVAVENEQRAREARDQLLRDHAAGRGDLRLADELHPAMIAVSACAHALDALYAEVATLHREDDLPSRKRRRRWQQIADLVDFAFNVEVAGWRPRLEELFRLRDAAVHPKMQWEAPQKHPALPVNVSSEYALFASETATKSVDLLEEILSTCIATPKQGAVEAWARDAAGPVARLASLRSEGR
jgi:hypothetical protein